MNLSGPGYRYYNPRRQLAQQLMQSGASTAPVPHWLQGLARMGQAAAGSYMMRKDAEQEQAAMDALAQGAGAKPWTNPDTGKTVGSGGGIKGAMSALSGMKNNPYAGRLTQQLMAANIERDQQLADLDNQRKWQAALLANNQAFTTAQAEEQFGRDKELAKIKGEQSMTAALDKLLAQDRLLRGLEADKPYYAAGMAPPVQGTMQAQAPMPDAVPAQQQAPAQGFPDAPQPQYAQPWSLAEAKAQEAAMKAGAETAAKSGGVNLTPAEKKVDEDFAKDYSELFVSGGVADVQKNLGQLDSVIAALNSGTDMLTGPILGNIPDSMKATFFTEAANTQDQVEEVVQRNHRLVLGAQFAEKEGARLIARAYNPRLGEAENAKRVQRLRDSIAKAYTAKVKAAQYYEQHGTLKGYEGSLAFTMDDIEKDALGDVGGVPENGDILNMFGG